MTTKIAKRSRTKPAKKPVASGQSTLMAEEERVLQLATQELILNHGGLLVATSARKVLIKSLPLWMIVVTLRYPTGHEGYVADLLYDGEAFTLVTDPSVMRERIHQVAADPERQRKWDDRTHSSSSTRKR